MPKFKVRVTRDAGTESAEIEVTADTRRQAGHKALIYADSGDTKPTKDAKFTSKWEFNEGNDPDDAYIGDPDIGDELGDDIEEMDAPTCKRCGANLRKNGYCKDVTCPYCDHKQDESFSEG